MLLISRTTMSVDSPRASTRSSAVTVMATHIVKALARLPAHLTLLDHGLEHRDGLDKLGADRSVLRLFAPAVGDVGRRVEPDKVEQLERLRCQPVVRV